MLHVLLEIQRRSPIRFDIGAATVDPQTPEYAPSCVRMCVCVCVRACEHAHMCTCTLVDIGAATIDAQTPEYDIQLCHLCVYVCLCVCISVYVHIGMRVYACLYV